MPSYLGQNFLKDTKAKRFITQQVAALYQKYDCQAIVEIGPGKGAITRYLVDISNNLHVIEKDETMESHLTKLQQDTIDSCTMTIHFQDVLEFDIQDFFTKIGLKPEQTIIVGNLPYYITSPILRKFFEGSGYQFPAGFFMVQKEVGEKIRYDAHKKSYLRWLLNYSHRVHYAKTIPAKAFSPAPRVDSCLFAIEREDSSHKRPAIDVLLEFLERVSPYKRKTMGAIQTLLRKKKAIDLQLPEQLKPMRLEELGREELTLFL